MKITWLDYSNEDSTIIDCALRDLEKISVEQLGFSSVRNNFRFELFPGAVNPMTRLRYNYMVAYVAKNLEDLGKDLKKIKAEDIQIRAEKKIRDILMKGEDKYGIFGIREKERVPFRTYWCNLYSYGLVDRAKYPHYDKYFNEVDIRRAVTQNSHKIEGEQNNESSIRFTLESLKDSEKSLIERLAKSHVISENNPGISFKLTKEEKEHFEKSIKKNFPESLLHQMLKDYDLIKKEGILNQQDPQDVWRKIERIYLKENYHQLCETLKMNLTYTFIFNRLMGVAYSYYYAILYQAVGTKETKDLLSSLKEKTLTALNNYPKDFDAEVTFNYISKKGSKQGHIFVKKIYQGLLKKESHDYFIELVKAREKEAKTITFAKLFLNKFENGKFKPILFGYDLNIRMIQGYLRDLDR